MSNNQKTTTGALSAAKAKAPFERTTIERRELRPDDILIDIKFVQKVLSVHTTH